MIHILDTVTQSIGPTTSIRAKMPPENDINNIDNLIDYYKEEENFIIKNGRRTIEAHVLKKADFLGRKF